MNLKKKNLLKIHEIFVKRLGFRGLEVLENAESQFPNETKINCYKNYLN